MLEITETKKHIEAVLRENYYLADAEIELIVSDGQLVGVVVSESFSGKGKMERQNFAWDCLAEKLSDEERDCIAYFITLTPKERDSVSFNNTVANDAADYEKLEDIDKDAAEIAPRNFEDSEEKRNKVEKEIRAVLNRYSQENASDTPDFILAQYLMGCLDAWNKATQRREKWYGRNGINDVIG